MAKKYSSTNITKTAKDFIHNKIVLYFVLAIAILNLLFSVIKGDLLFCTLFVLIGFITAFFNKNMIVILFVTVAVSNIIRVLISGGQFEGMKLSAGAGEDMKPSAGAGEDTSDSDPEEKEEDKKKETPTAKPASNKQESSQLIESVRNDANELLETQEKILQGFESIDVYMNKAGSLIEGIDNTAKKIEQMKTTATTK
jgi:hypothetical protein